MPQSRLGKNRVKISSIYLSQHAEPSAGWAQQAPSCPSSVLAGSQQTGLAAGFKQHDESSALLFDEILIFFKSGISAIAFSIFTNFVSLI